MQEGTKGRGLCSTCKNRPSCTFPTSADKPVAYCEEFEFDEPTSGKRAGRAPSTAEPRREHEEKTSHYTGLCVDCVNRQTCMFDKPEAGVWHCEEYR